MAGFHESDVWYRDTASLNGEATKAAEQHLSIEERGRLDRFHFEDDRRDFAIAHDLLRRKLSSRANVQPYDWQFARNGYGKPRIDSVDPRLCALSFSLTHTRGCVSCAITSNALIGVDIERIDRSVAVSDLADRFFSKDEAASLQRYSDDMRAIRFIELWTLKEAFLKAIGVGLSVPLGSVSFHFDEHDRIHFVGLPIFDPRQWHFAVFEPFGGVRLGVAIRSVGPHRLRVREDGSEDALLPPLSASQSGFICGREPDLQPRGNSVA